MAWSESPAIVTVTAKILARRAVDPQADTEDVWNVMRPKAQDAFRIQAAELLGEIERLVVTLEQSRQVEP